MYSEITARQKSERALIVARHSHNPVARRAIPQHERCAATNARAAPAAQHEELRDVEVAGILRLRRASGDECEPGDLSNVTTFVPVGMSVMRRSQARSGRIPT